MRFDKMVVAAWLCLLSLAGVAGAQEAAAPDPVAPAPVAPAPVAPVPVESVVVELEPIEAVRVAPPAPVISPEALAEYRSQFIFLNEEEWLTLTAHRHGDHVWGSVTSNRVIHAKRGEQRESIDGADFYDAVGRPDLASSYRNRRNLRIGFGIGAGALVVFGLYEFWKSSSLHDDTIDNNDCPLGDGYIACVERDYVADQELLDESDSRFRTGLIGIGAGVIIGVIVQRYVRSHPVSDDERRFLVTKYNRSLRERLGIPEPRILDVGPYAAGGGGGGVVVTGQF
jgi:hypothetical protein